MWDSCWTLFALFLLAYPVYLPLGSAHFGRNSNLHDRCSPCSDSSRFQTRRASASCVDMTFQYPLTLTSMSECILGVASASRYRQQEAILIPQLPELLSIDEGGAQV